MSGHSLFSLVMNADLIVKSVLAMLLFFSVYSWAIILYKFNTLRKVEKENDVFVRNFKRSSSIEAIVAQMRYSPLANLYRQLADVPLGSERDEFRKTLRHQTSLEMGRLERHLSFLATTGSTAPFIGLFGTVWGIMNSFRGIGAAGAASLAVVAPGIAEALIATAAGLAAAIPAVIAYNYYLSRLRLITFQVEDFGQELIDHFSRTHGDGR